MSAIRHPVLITVFALGFVFHTERAEAGDNSAYIELLGNVPWVSVNYDRLLADEFSLRLGVSIAGHESTGILPMATLAFLPRLSGNSRFEIAAGIAYSAEEEGAEVIDLFGATANIGYRYQPQDGGIFFRAGLAGYYAISPSAMSGFGIALPGLSVGYTF